MHFFVSVVSFIEEIPDEGIPGSISLTTEQINKNKLFIFSTPCVKRQR